MIQIENQSSNRNVNSPNISKALTTVLLTLVSILILMLFIGNTFLDKGKTQTIPNPNTNKTFKLSQDYIGCWIDEENKNYIDIKNINNTTINFNFYLFQIAKIEDLTATLVSNNIASFKTDTTKYDMLLEGILTFEKDLITLEITKSDSDYINDGLQIKYYKGSLPENVYEGKYPKGINIFTGEEVSKNIPNTFVYKYEVLTNQEYINNGKDQLDIVLNKYPEGFWNELLLDKENCRKSLVISLVGNLSSSNMIYSSPTGFATYDEDTYYVFVNSSHAGPTGANIELTIFHELMHIIDFYLQEKGEQYLDWYNYLPEGFVYTEYTSTHSQSQFDICMTHAQNNNDVWFDTIYSTETELEDRACMMSQMYMEGLSYYKKYPHLYAKMKYLSEILYNNFETIRNCEYDWLE